MAKEDKIKNEIISEILRSVNDIEAADAVIGMTKDQMKVVKIDEALCKFKGLIKGRTLLMMKEVEAEGWTLTRFINTFAELVNREINK